MTTPQREVGKASEFPTSLVCSLTHPRLRRLGLALDRPQKKIGPFEPHIPGWLSGLALPIEALDLRYDIPLGSSLNYDLVGIWPTIRALSVITTHILPPERPSINLHPLRLWVPCSATVIEWYLPPPPPNEQSNLQFLELYKIPEEALPVLSIHGPTVSTLTLAFQPAFEIAHLFTKSEELVISGRFWSSPPHAFPRTLKHIRLHFDDFMADSAVAAIAQVSPMLPDLRVLSVEKALVSSKYYPHLQEACETQSGDSGIFNRLV